MEINYRLSTLNESEFRMNYDFDYNSFDIGDTHVEIGHEITTIPEKDLLIIVAKAVILYGDNGIELVADTIRMGFEVSPMDGFITKKDQDQILVKSPEIMDTSSWPQ